MNARITLTGMSGPLSGQRFVFPIAMKVAVGRSPECALRIRGEPNDLTVSRRHCVLVIDPPTLRVRDLGSRNGTYVNGTKIATQARSSFSEDGGSPDPVGFELHDGDWLQVGASEFQVRVQECGTEEDTTEPSLGRGYACSC
jgi:eukaryotic-like serine/threonine-protein kinase